MVIMEFKKSLAKNKKQGAALVIALIIMLIVMLLGLSLLTVTYSVFHSSVNSSADAQCRELAVSFADALGEQICSVPVYESYQKESEAAMGGEYPLYFLIRYNLCQDKWPVRGSGSPDESWSFEVDPQTVDYPEIPDGTQVWAELFWEGDPAENNVILTIKTSCISGSEEESIYRDYSLTVQDYTVNEGITQEMETDYVIPSSEFNYYGQEINASEQWIWKVVE